MFCSSSPIEVYHRSAVVAGDFAGRRGVWFFSLDAARLAAVAGARFAYSLPYYWSRMELRSEDHRASYRSARRESPEVLTDIEVKIGLTGAAVTLWSNRAQRISCPSGKRLFTTRRTSPIHPPLLTLWSRALMPIPGKSNQRLVLVILVPQRSPSSMTSH